MFSLGCVIHWAVLQKICSSVSFTKTQQLFGHIEFIHKLIWIILSKYELHLQTF